MNEKTSIYLITNSANGKIYVGRTRAGIALRLKRHCWAARKGDTYLGRAIAKHGKNHFSIRILEEVDHEEANSKEAEWIAKMRSNDRGVGYNLSWASTGAGEVAKDTRALLGVASRKFWSSMTAEERSALLSKRLTGVAKTKEHGTNISRSKAGRSPAVGKTSRFVGVSFRRQDKNTPWVAMLYISGKVYARCCRSEIEAARCYDRLALAARGPDTCINFPEDLRAYLAEDLQAHLNEKPITTSGYRFVSKNAKSGRWCVFYKTRYRGSCATEYEAAELAAEVSGLSMAQLLKAS